MSSPAELQELAALMALARRKGFAIDVSFAPGQWRIVARDMKLTRAPGGNVAFTINEARAFLVTLPDA